MRIFRLAKEEEERSIFELLRQEGLERHLDYDTWSRQMRWWKTNWGPNGSTIGTVMEIDGVVAGFAGHRLAEFKIGDGVRPGQFLGSFVIEKKQRGVGGLLLARHIVSQKEQYPVYGTHFNEALGKTWAFVGAQKLEGTDRTYVGVVSWRNAILHRVQNLRLLAPFLSLADLPFLRSFWESWTGMSRCRVTGSWGLKVKVESSLESCGEAAVVELCKKFEAAYDFGILRSFGYLNWRYEKHPHSTCRWVVINDGSAVIGMAVLRLRSNGRAFIDEIIFDPSIPEIESKCLDGVLRCAETLGISVLISKSILPAMADSFLQKGFSEQQKKYEQGLSATEGDVAGRLLFTYGDFNFD